MQVRHVLVTSDLSEESRRAFAPAREVARAFGARLTLLHVIQLFVPATHPEIEAVPLSPRDLTSDRDAAQRALQEQARAFDAGIKVSVEVVTGTDVAQTIVEFAGTHEVDWIVTSTHGRRGVRRFMLGSVAEIVVRRSHVPVLCVPPPSQAR